MAAIVEFHLQGDTADLLNPSPAREVAAELCRKGIDGESLDRDDLHWLA